MQTSSAFKQGSHGTQLKFLRKLVFVTVIVQCLK